MKKFFMFLLAVFFVGIISISNSYAFTTNVIDECIKYLQLNDLKSALNYGQRAVNLYPTSVSAHFCLADAYRLSGIYDKALNHYILAKNFAKNIEDLNIIYNRMGIVYSNLGNYENALFYLNQFLKYARSTKNQTDIITALNNIAETYRKMKQTQKAIDYFLQIINIEEKNEENLISVYNNLGLSYIDIKDMKNAEKYLLKALETSNKYGHYYFSAVASYNLGDFYFLNNNYDEAEKHLKEALVKNQKIDNKLVIGKIYSLLGAIEMNRKNYSMSKEYFNKAQDYFQLVGAIEDLTIVRNLSKLLPQ